MSTLTNLLRFVVRPRRTCREVLRQETINASLAVVLGFGIVVGLLFLRSYLAQDYPPPADELETVEDLSEFTVIFTSDHTTDEIREAVSLDGVQAIDFHGAETPEPAAAREVVGEPQADEATPAASRPPEPERTAFGDALRLALHPCP